MTDPIQMSQAISTPIIGLLALYIAWEQWRTNRQKLDLDRYERRLRIYDGVRGVIETVVRNADPDYSQLVQFRSESYHADFLFGADITRYLNEVYQRGLALRNWNRQYKDLYQEKPVDYDHAKVCAGLEAELEWFQAEQGGGVKERFRRYLDISK